MAQVSESNPHTDDSSESQDWSYNWSEGWKNRRAKLSAAKYRITHWQLGERSLLTLYGHLNVSQLGFDDGFVNEATVGDNPNSPSRVGITLETEYDSGQNLFWNLEATVPKGRYKSSVSDYLAGGNDAQWDITMLRKAEARLSAPRFGFFSFGQGSMAADGITGLDFSGTAVVASNNVGDSVSGVPARLVDGTTTNSNISSYFPNYDAARRLRLRYDSLSPNGLSWSAAVGREVLTDGNDETYADVALRYETRWRRFGVRSGIGYTYNGSSPGFLSGSVAGLDDNTGLNFAIAMGTSTSGGRYAYGKLGIIRHFFKSGSTAVSADYYASSSPLIDASGSRSWGLAAVQRFDAQDLELYATYRDYAIDGTVRKFADSNAILIGLRFTW